MPSYGMTGNLTGYGYGGGGFGGLGDWGQSIYTGLGNAMPMLTQFYNFQDTNALRQDALNAAKSNMMANTMQDQNSYIDQTARNINKMRDFATAGHNCANGVCVDPLSGSTYQDPNYHPIQNTVANASAASQSTYTPQVVPTAAAEQMWYASNPIEKRMSAMGLLGQENIGLGSSPYGRYLGGAFK